MNTPSSKRSKIDLETYSRRHLFEYFSNKDYPFASIVVQLNITDFHEFKKEKGLSFFLSLTYLIQEAMNSVEEMKHRIIDKKLCSYDVIHPAFT